tara:strand:+ start:12848 stop:13864 length:1017 start_codon:yes stop_codon:yes gene_type:complete
MNKINVAILGCGRMGNRHAIAYKKNSDVKLVGFYDSDISVSKNLSLKYNSKYFNSYSELFHDSTIDAISICTPNALHFNFIKLGIKYKKHILVEKPIVTKFKECDILHNLMKNNKKNLMVGHTHRFFSCNTMVKKLLDSGKIGKPLLINTFDYIPGRIPTENMPSWVKNKKISGGGIFITDLVHTIDKITWWFKSDVEKVYVPYLSNSISKKNVEDVGIVILWLKNGTVATCIHGSPSPGKLDMSTKILGDKGEISLQFGSKLELINKKITLVKYPFQNRSSSHTLNGFYDEINEFIDSIKQKRAPSVNYDSGIKTVKTVLSLYESMKKKSPIHVNYS